MLKHSTKFRVRYGETDRMGFVYYGNYAEYFEVGRVEWLRNIGLSYKKMEDSGVLLPVFTHFTKYLKPALYDDILTLETILKKVPASKIEFNYKMLNENKELITVAETVLVFLDKVTKKPVRCPQYLLDKIK